MYCAYKLTIPLNKYIGQAISTIQYIFSSLPMTEMTGWLCSNVQSSFPFGLKIPIRFVPYF